MVITEGARKAVIIMEKDSSRFSSTGGWGFGLFGGETQEAAEIDANACFECHQAAAETDFIFSRYRP